MQLDSKVSLIMSSGPIAQRKLASSSNQWFKSTYKTVQIHFHTGHQVAASYCEISAQLFVFKLMLRQRNNVSRSDN